MKSVLNAKYQNIIIRMPNWIGDMVMATPVISEIRRSFPNSKITAMCRSPVCDLLKEDTEIDELFCFSKINKLSRRSEKKYIIEKLRQAKYDLGILLTHSLSSACWFWQGKVKTTLGYNCRGRRFFLTHPIRFSDKVQKQHLVFTYKNILEPLGIPISNLHPRLFLTDQEKNHAKTLLIQHKVQKDTTLIGINPGATYGSTKCWPPERFRAVVNKLLTDPKIRILFFGDIQSIPLVKKICQKFGPRVVNLSGLTSLREAAALINLCDLLLTNDSGLMHIADALETDIVALFGSTNELITGPYRKAKVIHKHVECSPCYRRVCPTDFKCMKKISTEEVCEAIFQKLKKTNPKLHVII